jgi:hypothetical protein
MCNCSVNQTEVTMKKHGILILIVYCLVRRIVFEMLPTIGQQSSIESIRKSLFTYSFRFPISFSIRFHSLFQCSHCLTYHVEPINFTIVTPYKAMTHTSMRDFSVFKNEHRTRKKTMPGREHRQIDACLVGKIKKRI